MNYFLWITYLQVLTKFTEENNLLNIYVEFRNDKIVIYACVATPCLVTSPPLKLM